MATRSPVTREARAMAAMLQATINCDCQFRFGLNHTLGDSFIGLRNLMFIIVSKGSLRAPGSKRESGDEEEGRESGCPHLGRWKTLSKLGR